MRHSAGERADTFEPLCPKELFLDSLLFGDVGVNDQNGFRFSQLIPHECPATSDHDNVAVFAKVLTLAGPLAALYYSHSCRKGRGGGLSVKKGGSLLTLNFRRIPTIQLFRPMIPILDAIFHVADHDRVMSHIQQFGLFPQAAFRLLSLGDIKSGHDASGHICPHNGARVDFD